MNTLNPSPKYDLAVIDFETANNHLNSACQIGIAFIKNLEIVERYSSLIKPPNNYFAKENIKVHDILPEQTEHEKSFDLIFNDLKSKFDNCHFLAAHNAQFDMSVLFQSLKFYGIAIPHYQYFDTMSYFSKAKESHVRNGLADIARWLQLDNSAHHDALADANLTAQAVIKTTILLNQPNVPSYLSKYSDIRIRPLELIKSQPTFNNAKRFEKVSITEINKQEILAHNVNHPLYGKNIVFTGDFSISKKQMMEAAREKGATIKSSVSTLTDYLVEGTQDPKYMDENGLVSKQRKAIELISKGHNIERLSEDEFLRL